MGQGYPDSKSATCLREPGSQTVQPYFRPAIPVARNLDLPPPHSSCPRQRLHGLVDRLLRGNSRGGVSGGIGSRAKIFPLLIGEKAVHRMVAFVGEKSPDTIEIDQVDTHTDDTHSRFHQNSATPLSMSGTGR